MKIFFKILFFGSVIASLSSCGLSKCLSWQSNTDDGDYSGTGGSNSGGQHQSSSNTGSNANYSPGKRENFVVISGSGKNGSYVNRGAYVGISHH